MKKLNFKATVNPFKQECILKVKHNSVDYSIGLIIDSMDTWTSFGVGNRVFDIHFLYDAEFLVEIYEVFDNKVDYTAQQKVKLSIKLTD